MIHASRLKAHRTACSLRAKRGASVRLVERKGPREKDAIRGGSFARERIAKLHAVTDAKGRPICFFMSAGQVSDHAGAAALLDSLPQADWFLANRGYDTD